MEEQKQKIYSSLSLLCFNLFIASLILVACSYFSLLVLDIIVNPDIVFGAGMFLGFLALIFWEKSRGKWNLDFSKSKETKSKKEKVVKSSARVQFREGEDDNLFFKIVPYLFLFMLLVIALNQFFKWDFITAQMMRITILAITFGAITFWRNRERVENEIEQEKTDEESAELKRESEFDKKFKRLAWFNFDYGVASSFKESNWLSGIFRILISPFVWVARLPYSFVKWMYREGWGYSIGLITIVILGFVLRATGVSLLSAWVDEANSLIVVKNLVNGFGPTLMNDVVYNRALPYHYYLSFLIKIFGHDQITARLANLPFYIILVTTIYCFAKKLFSKKVALTSILFFVFSWFSISMFRDIRFYEMFLSFFVLSSFILLGLIDKIFSYKFYEKNKLFFSKNDLFLFILFILSLFMSYLLHESSALILYVFFFLGVYSFLAYQKVSSLFLSFVSLIILIGGLIFEYGSKFNWSHLINPPGPDWKSGLGQTNILDFWNYLLINHYQFLVLLVPIGISIFLTKRNLKLAFLFALSFGLYFLISLQGYGIIAIRYYYICFPFFTIFLSYTILYLSKYLGKNRVNSFNVFVGILLIIMPFVFIGVSNETFSPYHLNSLYEPRNIDYDHLFANIQNLTNLSNSFIVTDTGLAMPFYISTNLIPDGILDLKNSSVNTTYNYTNTPFIYYEDLKKINESVVVILFTRTKYFIKENNETINPAIIGFFDKNGSRIYGSDSISVYYFNSTR